MRGFVEHNPIEKGGKIARLAVKQGIQAKASSAENEIGHCQDLISVVHIGQGEALIVLGQRRALSPFQATPRKFFSTYEGRLEKLLDFTQEVINGLMRQCADRQAQGAATLLRLQEKSNEHTGEDVRFASARWTFNQPQGGAKGQEHGVALSCIEAYLFDPVWRPRRFRSWLCSS